MTNIKFLTFLLKQNSFEYRWQSNQLYIKRCVNKYAYNLVEQNFKNTIHIDKEHCK